jgi:hypothetical protein
MATDEEDITAQVMGLPVEARLRLARTLLRGLDPVQLREVWAWLAAPSLGGRLVDRVHDATSRYGAEMSHLKIVIEEHADGFVAYPLGMKGVVVGEGATFDDALRDVKSAIQFHLDTFGADALESESPVLAAFVIDA